MPKTYTFTTYITAQLDAGFTDDVLVEVTFTSEPADYGVDHSPVWDDIEITEVKLEGGLDLPEPDFATWHDHLVEKAQDYLDSLGETK